MKIGKLHFGSVLVVLATLLGILLFSGCGTSPTSTSAPSPTPQAIPTYTTVTGTAWAPSGTAYAQNGSFLDRVVQVFISVAEALTGQTQLSNATVKAYNFYSGALLATTTTDPSGNYSLPNIAQGIDIVVVVEKDVAGGHLRLSAVIPDVDVQTTITGTIDASTTLVSEQMCTYFGQNFDVIPQYILTMHASADASLAGTSAVNLVVGQGNVRDPFGSGLVSNEVTYPVILATPDLTQMKVGLAKAMVQSIRDAMTTAGQFGQLVNYPHSVEAYFDSIITQGEDVFNASRYVGAIASGEYYILATMDAIYVGPTSPGIWVFDLESGKKVTIEVISIITPESTYDDGYVKYNFWVTSASDAALYYHGYAEGSGGIVATNEAFPFSGHMQAYLSDGVIPEPITFEADITQTGTGTPPDYTYHSVTFSGLFVGKEIKIDGTIDVGSSGGSTYPFPMPLSFQGVIETPKQHLEGTLNATLVTNNATITDVGRIITREVIESATWQGELSTKVAPTATYEGTMSYNLENASTADFATYEASNFPKMTASFNGIARGAGLPVLQANINGDMRTFNKDSISMFLSFGLNSLSGTVVNDRGVNPNALTFSLTNQYGVVTNLTAEYDPLLAHNIHDTYFISASGTIKTSDGTTVATFSMLGRLIEVDYTDGTFETLF
jgi:hypothetical protein